MIYQPFQSLTRDSNHSNFAADLARGVISFGFNPSRGIAIIQTVNITMGDGALNGFNPSRGIAIIQTVLCSS